MDIPKTRYREISRDALAILVALADGPQIGSKIQSHIIGITLGHFIRDSALYDILHRLEGQNLVIRTSKRYTLTDQGWRRLKVEAQILRPLLEHTTRRLERHEASLVMARE
jgi:DNA-binding PadR family transcriptional regulator